MAGTFAAIISHFLPIFLKNFDEQIHIKGFFRSLSPHSNFPLLWLSFSIPLGSNIKEMDTSNPAVFVNAELLRIHVGRRVRAVIQVLRSDGSGSVFGKSTDEQQLVIKGSPPSPLSTFVEVIGIADSNQSIKAEIWTNFGDNLDPACYNNVCQLANGDFKHLFI